MNTRAPSRRTTCGEPIVAPVGLSAFSCEGRGTLSAEKLAEIAAAREAGLAAAREWRNRTPKPAVGHMSFDHRTCAEWR